MSLLRANLFACPSCGAACDTKLRCEVSFKTCILTHRRRMAEEYGACLAAPPAGSAVPPVLLRVDPRISEDRFEAVVTDPTFLYRTLHVCEDCALEHNAVAEQDLTRELPPALMKMHVSAMENVGHGFGGADATVTVGPNSRASFGPSREARLIDGWALFIRPPASRHSPAASFLPPRFENARRATVDRMFVSHRRLRRWRREP